MKKDGWYFLAQDEALPTGPFASREIAEERARLRNQRVAFDYKSVRSYDADGHLKVARTPISKANVCEYFGHEIPGADELGLDRNKRYALLRDPDELKKAAPSSNGKQLLIKHIPVDADDHHPDDTVGAIGTDAEFVAPYLYNSLSVWDRKGIDGIESGKQKELSSAYRYRADMTPGEYLGTPYDGVMRDIDFNHVALVPEGRAGSDVVVGDAKPKYEGDDLMTIKNVLTRKGTYSAGVLAGYLMPRLAQDSKLDLSKLFDGVTTKNFSEKKAGIISAIKKEKLAADAELDHLPELLDKLEKKEIAEGADADPSSGLPLNAAEMEKKAKDEKTAKDKAARDAASNFLASKLSAEDKKAFDDMMGEVDGLDEGERAVENVEGAEGGGGEDEFPEKDKEPKVTQKAMDAAIKVATETATRNALKTANEISEAKDVASKWVGRLAMDAVCAADVYKVALDHLKVDMKDVHPSAFRKILELQPVPGAKEKTTIASDSVIDATGFQGRFGNLTDRISITG